MSLCNFNLREKVDRVPLRVELLPLQPSRSTFEFIILLYHYYFRLLQTDLDELYQVDFGNTASLQFRRKGHDLVFVYCS